MLYLGIKYVIFLLVVLLLCVCYTLHRLFILPAQANIIYEQNISFEKVAF